LVKKHWINAGGCREGEQNAIFNFVNVNYKTMVWFS
jgi:hypothetical protein